LTLPDTIMLTASQKRHLRSLAHGLNPVILTGAGGLSENLLSELDRALEHHELIKVRVNAEDRESRDAMIESMREAVKADLVQRIGHIAVLYRPAKEPRLKLP